MGRETKPGVTAGDRVWIEYLKEHGTVLTVSRDGGRVVVQVGKVNLDLPVTGLGRPRKVRTNEVLAPGSVRRPGRKSATCREIDMHGLRVEETLARLDQFLNDAMLEGCQEVRIVHGHGTGALRKAVHQRLKTLGIRRFRLGEMGQTPGGDGVTVVTL